MEVELLELVALAFDADEAARKISFLSVLRARIHDLMYAAWCDGSKGNPVSPLTKRLASS